MSQSKAQTSLISKKQKTSRTCSPVQVRLLITSFKRQTRRNRFKKEVAVWAQPVTPNLQILHIPRHLILFATFLIATNAYSISLDDVKSLTFAETDSRVEALSKAALHADEKTVAFIQALSDDAVKSAVTKYL